MKRTIKLKAGNIVVVAKLDTKGELTPHETARVVTDLADNLMKALSDIPYGQGASFSRQELKL